MITRARRIAAAKALKPPHVAFVKAALTGDLPVESNSVDCILSNCVINLLPPVGKRKVMQEVYRILRPGGRVSLDDVRQLRIPLDDFLKYTQIIAQKPFPDSLRTNVAAYVGCISGAILLQDYQALMQDAGFKGGLALEQNVVGDQIYVWEDVVFTENPSDLNVYLNGGSTGCCGPASSELSALTDIGDLNEWASEYCAINVSFALTTSTPPEFKRVLPNLFYEDRQFYCRQLSARIRPQELVGRVSGSSVTREQLGVRRGRGSHQESGTRRERFCCG
jgi:arsenite methyltransferase